LFDEEIFYNPEREKLEEPHQVTLETI
jgi:hypothetical protein